jgi:hypothetical protein
MPTADPLRDDNKKGDGNSKSNGNGNADSDLS